MTNILLTTKLKIPQLRTNRIRRSDLVARLQENLDKKLILLSAPAGYGKTTLIIDWLKTHKHRAAWITLDKRDNDPARFWLYFSSALREVCPSLGESFTNYSLPTNPSLLETNLIANINDLANLDQTIILVLDDYQNINSPTVHEAVSFLINHAPACCHIVISTRADPPLHLGKLRGCSQMIDFRLTDLLFTREEIAEFMVNVLNLQLSEIDLALLEKTTEGWIAGLQMAGLSIQGKEDVSDYIQSFSGEDRYIMDFLFEEVFNLQSKEMQEFLLKTSILERLCESLCDAVTQDENGQACLRYLELNNLFLIPLDEQRKWYRYHFLFRDLLQNRLKHSSSKDPDMLHSLASVWYETEGDLELAIIHALAAGDFDHMAALLENITESLDFQTQQALLSSWLEKIPVDVVYQHPWLCVYRAWGAYWTGHRENIDDPWLITAEKAAVNYNVHQRQRILGTIAAIRAHLALISKDIPLVFDSSKIALDLLPEGDGMRSEALIALAGAYWALGDLVQTKETFFSARNEALKINYRSMAAGISGFIAIQQVKQGFLDDAITTLQQGIKLASLPNQNEMSMAGFINCRLGDIWREKNQLDIALGYLNKGIIQSQNLGQPDILADSYCCLARYKLAVGDIESAHEILDKADSIARDSKIDVWILSWLDDCRIRAWAAKGDIASINIWEQTSGLTLSDPMDYQTDLNHQNLARVFVIRHVMNKSSTEFEKANLLLNRLLFAAKLAGWVHEQIRILILKAVNFKARNYSSEAVQSLLQAILLSSPREYIQLFIEEGQVLYELFDILMDFPDEIVDKHLRTINPSIQSFELVSCKVNIKKINEAFHEAVIGNSLTKEHKMQTSPQKIASLDTFSVKLTVREMDVLCLLSKGFPNRKIAEKLFITPGTVHKHLKNIYSKLDVHSRTEAIIHAQELGLI